MVTIPMPVSHQQKAEEDVFRHGHTQQHETIERYTKPSTQIDVDFFYNGKMAEKINNIVRIKINAFTMIYTWDYQYATMKKYLQKLLLYAYLVAFNTQVCASKNDYCI